MRLLLSIVWIIVMSTAVQAQEIWESQPLTLAHSVKGMIYDETLDVSYVFGSFSYFEDDSVSTNVIVYDGTDYYSMPKCPVGDIWDMEVYKGKLYAAGGGLYSVAVWDGDSWETIEEKGLIFNLKVIDDKLYVLGNFDSMAGIPALSIAIYNDTNWTGNFLGIDTVIDRGWAIDDIVFYKGKVYVCGNFIDWDNPELRDIMMHDGESWKPVGDFQIDGLGSLRRLLVWRDTLYVAGMMVEASGSPGNCIAAWDGENWHRLQDGVNGQSGRTGGSIIRDMMVYHDELWVGGLFKVINGRFVHSDYGGVAKWDGTQWCTMNSWVRGTVIKLGTWRDELFITGDFVLKDGSNGQRVVKWVGGDYTDTCIIKETTGVNDFPESLSHIQLYPNPAQGAINLSFSSSALLNSRQSIKLEIIDIYGRVLKMFQQEFGIGDNFYTIDISMLQTGNYILKLSTDQTVESIQFNKQ